MTDDMAVHKWSDSKRRKYAKNPKRLERIEREVEQEVEAMTDIESRLRDALASCDDFSVRLRVAHLLLNQIAVHLIYSLDESESAAQLIDSTNQALRMLRDATSWSFSADTRRQRMTDTEINLLDASDRLLESALAQRDELGRKVVRLENVLAEIVILLSITAGDSDNAARLLREARKALSC